MRLKWSLPVVLLLLAACGPRPALPSAREPVYVSPPVLAWTTTLVDVSAPTSTSFAPGYGQTEAETLLWFQAGEQGVVVSNILDEGRNTLFGVDPADGQIAWQRDLPYGSNECRRLSADDIVCLNRPMGQLHSFSEVSVLRGRDGRTSSAWSFGADEVLSLQASSGHVFVLHSVDDGSGAREVMMSRFTDGTGADWSVPLDLPTDWVDKPYGISSDVSEPEGLIRIGYSDEEEFAVDIADPDRPEFVHAATPARSVRTTQIAGDWWLQHRYSKKADAIVWTLLGRGGQSIALGAGSQWDRYSPGTPNGPEGSWLGLGRRVVHLPTGHVTDVRCANDEAYADRAWSPRRDEVVVFGEHHIVACSVRSGRPRVEVPIDSTGEDSGLLDSRTGPSFIGTISVGGALTVRGLDLDVVATLPLEGGFKYSDITPTPGGFVLLDAGQMRGYSTS